MKKELRPFHDPLSCEVCGRTILKGERTETYLAPGGHRNLVCELCFVRAEHAGWIRESAADDMPTRAGRQPERRALLGRLMRRRGDQDRPAPPAPAGEPAPPADAEIYRDRSREREGMPFDGEPEHEPEQQPAPPPRRRERPKDPRHVRAVPTTAEAKVERALDLFNASEHQRTAAGLTRTLGFPWATAIPDPEAPSAVVVVVAWELSWYRYRIDLGDTAEAVTLLDKGDEIADIAEPLREWNAGLDEEGRLVMQGGVTT
ncbi:MAG: hypothetical protein GXY03_01310 [Solirubrobacterales bacterium]|nr:hypothetical protein [Solirubrobacterales bacterium]